MSKESLEHLSSLMDGEMSRETGLFLTRRLASDDEMCDTWERFHLIRDCIRQPGSKLLVTGLSVRLMDAEEAHRQSSWRNNSWLKPVSGLAIAASVALMAIVVTTPQQGTIPGAAGDTALSTPANQPFVSPNTLAVSPQSQAASFSTTQQLNSNNRLNAYLLRHNQMARTAGRQGFVSFVPIVATPTVATAEQVEDASDSVKTDTEQEITENK
jgi:sigma-E factor negative regulatory protein RseA